jgi:biotin carboxyl carrier protein
LYERRECEEYEQKESGKLATIISSMPGTVIDIKVKVGDQVTHGQEVCVIEAMKMQVPMKSNQNGVVKEIRMAVGQSIAKGVVLIELE